jgi:hypothetical protein
VLEQQAQINTEEANSMPPEDVCDFAFYYRATSGITIPPIICIASIQSLATDLCKIQSTE